MNADEGAFIGLRQTIRGVSDQAGRATEGVLCVITSAVVVLIGAQVLFRYVLNHSLFWAEELGRILLVWITFLGASAAFRREGHMGVDLLVRRLPPFARFVCRCSVLVAASAFFLILVGFGLRYCWFVSSQKTPALGIPMAIPYLVLPVAGFLFFVHACRQLMDAFSEMKV
jgi:TRAP-type C4-dicarboxylate transport system permease small subunit